jgi:copper chaperone CopZ
MTPNPNTPSPTVAWLAIWGMYCPECQARVKEALQRLPGVLEVEVDWVYMGARVVLVPGAAGVDDLIACVGAVDTHAEYAFWAASGPEVSSALQDTWALRGLH